VLGAVLVQGTHRFGVAGQIVELVAVLPVVFVAPPHAT
jgi:hypothetical protein